MNLRLNISIKGFGKLLNVSDINIFLWENNKVKPRIKNHPNLLKFVGFIF